MFRDGNNINPNENSKRILDPTAVEFPFVLVLVAVAPPPDSNHLHGHRNLKKIQTNKSSIPLKPNLVIGRKDFQFLCITNCCICGSKYDCKDVGSNDLLMSTRSEQKSKSLTEGDRNRNTTATDSDSIALCNTCQIQTTFFAKYTSRKMFEFSFHPQDGKEEQSNEHWKIRWMGKNEHVAFINGRGMKRLETYPIHAFRLPTTTTSLDSPTSTSATTSRSSRSNIDTTIHSTSTYTRIQLCDPHQYPQDGTLDISVVAEYVIMEIPKQDDIPIVMDLTDSPTNRYIPCHDIHPETTLIQVPTSNELLSVHSDSSSNNVCTTTNSSDTPRSNIQPNAVFFLHKGLNMTSLRIKKLMDILEENMGDAMTVQSTFHINTLPKYLVIDPVLSKEVICQALGFRDMKQMIVSLLDVYIVIPNFILVLRSLDEPPPTAYCHGLMAEIRKMNQTLHLTSLDSDGSNVHISEKGKNANVTLDHRKRPRLSEIASDSEMSSHATSRVSSSPSLGRNKEISELLEKISQIYKESPLDKHDVWRSYMYKICSTRILHLDFEIRLNDPESMKRLQQLKGFGSSIQQTIRDFLLLNRCKRLNDLESDEKRLGMRNLTRIWGVGPSKALEWVNLGYRTIQDIRTASELGEVILGQNQKIGVRYYEDFLQKMPRHETREIGKIVTEAVKCFFPNAEVMIMGSYRRGAMQNGDIDILITLPNYKYGDHAIPNGALDELVERMMEEGYISNHLTKVDPQYRKRMPSQKDELIDDYLPRYEQQTYMGVFYSPQVPGRMRRIDIKFYPYRDKAFAMLYFTGNGYFNRAMRLYAKRAKDMKLKDCGLFIMSLGREVKRIECATEEDIFKALDLIYCEPRARDGLDAVQVRVKGDNGLTLKGEEGSWNRIHPTEEDILHDSQHPWID